jgi:endonuclease YncB( thermonuclease family)
MPRPCSMDPARTRVVRWLSAWLLAITGTSVQAVPPPPPDDVRIVGVLDGRTIVVTPYGDPFRVRLACLQAPHPPQGGAALAARAALEKLLPPGTWVALARRSTAADGVELAEAVAAGTAPPVNLQLVRDGMAVLDRNASGPCSQESYREADRKARTTRLGLWRRLACIPPRRP